MKLFANACLGLICLWLSFITQAETYLTDGLPDIEVGQAAIFLPQYGASGTGSKMTIYNRSDKPLIIKQIVCDVFDSIMFHTTKFESGQRSMSPVGSLTVAAHHDLVLTPNTTHIMLMGIKRPLQSGEYLTLSLATNQGVLSVIAQVVPMTIR
jgi:periplasmic copper chaperone A